jgi:hypothetical protein
MVMITEALENTLRMMKAIAKSADIKVRRGFTDFLADRIVQAGTQQTLMKMLERLSALLNSRIDEIKTPLLTEFLKSLPSCDQAILAWLREYPRIAAMIIMLPDEGTFKDALKTIEITENASDKGIALSSGVKFDIPIKITCLSPLAHGSDAKAGNATIFRRMQALSDTGQILFLPFYAGNALRGQMRDLLADHYLSALGLVPDKANPPCSLWFFHALYAGGALEENSAQAKGFLKSLGTNGSANAEGLYTFRDMIPPLSLLGAALGNRIISGRINVGDYRPVCKEWGTGNIVAGELFEWTYLTRREDHENHAQDENSSMIVNTECLRAGTILNGGIDVSNHMTEIEASCLGMGLKLLQANGYLGAENRRGLGKVRIDIENLKDSSLYESFLKDSAINILKYLAEILGIIAPDKSLC